MNKRHERSQSWRPGDKSLRYSPESGSVYKTAAVDEYLFIKSNRIHISLI